METITAGREGLAVHLEIVGGAEDGVLVGSGAPGSGLAVAEAEVRHAVGDELAPDLTAAVLAVGSVYRRARVVDGDFDETEVLGNGGFLIVSAGRQRKTLEPGLAERRGGEDKERSDREQQAHGRIDGRLPELFAVWGEMHRGVEIRV